MNFYIVDAFSNGVFTGNQAGVCILEDTLEDSEMLKIASEINFSETAFIKKKNNDFQIRWFTPKQEMNLCGHATLAAAKVVNHIYGNDEINFISNSGNLSIKKRNNEYEMNFPIDNYITIEKNKKILKGLGIEDCSEAIKGENTEKIIYILEEETQIKKINPNFDYLKENFNLKGIGVSAKGKKYDIISRYFNPWAGVNEDSVTGSVHTVLANYWTKKLKKNNLNAFQASKRSGVIKIKKQDSKRILLIGKANIFLEGKINL